MVELLLTAGADKSIKNSDEKTALDCVKEKDQKEIVALLEAK